MTNLQPDTAASPAVLASGWAVLAATVLWHGLRPITDPDLWWQMRLGEQMLATGTRIAVDPFSSTVAGAPWAYKDGGFAVLAHTLWTVGGATAIVVFKAAALAGLVALLWRMLRHARSLPPALASVAVAIAVEGIGPQFFASAASWSLLPLAAVVLLVERDRQGHSGLWAAIALTVVGANLDRCALVLPVLLAAYAIVCAVEAGSGRETHASAHWKRNVAIAAGSGLACLATPSTTALFGATVRAATTSLTTWAPIPTTALVAGLVILSGVALLARARPLPIWDLVLLLLALGAGALGQEASFALLGIGPIARAVAPWTGWIRRTGGALVIASAAATFALAVGGPLPAPSLGLAPGRFPERGVAFVQGLPATQRLHGNVLNEYEFGGYFLFHLWPEFRVFVDGRGAMVYPPTLLLAYVRALVDADAFAALAERYDIQWVMLDNAPNLRARAHFDANPAWTLIHASRRTLVYVRADGPNAGLARAYGFELLWAHDLDGSIARANAAGRGAQAADELARMVMEDPDHLHAREALARLGGPHP